MNEQALRVKFGDPCAGWLGIEITTPREQVSGAVSYTPNDFLLELMTALSLSLQGMNAIATASCEPTTYEFTFSQSPQEGVLHFRVTEYADWKKARPEAITVLTACACPRDIVRPFWRAFRDLEGRISAEAYLDAFHREFPVACLHRLTQMVDAMRDE